jgi:multiple sugar transport system ATP-binding protein
VPFTARLSPRTTVRAGRPVKLAVDVERFHLFDPGSGRNLR